MVKSVSKKMSIKEGIRSIFINAPQDAIEAINPPNLELETNLIDDFDYIHLFVNSQKEYQEQFSKLKKHLKQTGMLWISAELCILTVDWTSSLDWNTTSFIG